MEKIPLEKYPPVEALLLRLKDRKAHPPEKIKNEDLYAGSPMYYYCTSCGHIADVKPEDWFLIPPRELCDVCQALIDLGVNPMEVQA